jgi:hypothetical protein
MPTLTALTRGRRLRPARRSPCCPLADASRSCTAGQRLSCRSPAARRGARFPGRGLWAAGSFGGRAITNAAALERRPRAIQVALLIVAAGIQPLDGSTRGRVSRRQPSPTRAGSPMPSSSWPTRTRAPRHASGSSPRSPRTRRPELADGTCRRRPPGCCRRPPMRLATDRRRAARRDRRRWPQVMLR